MSPSLLAALLLLEAPPAQPDPRPVAVTVAESDHGCIVSVAGRAFHLPQGQPGSPEQRRLEVALAALAAAGAEARVTVAPRTSYRCIGGAVFLAQKAGLRTSVSPDTPVPDQSTTSIR